MRNDYFIFSNPTPEIDEGTDFQWPSYEGNRSEPQFLNINDKDDVRVDDDRSNFVFQVWRVAHECLYYYRCLELEVMKGRIEKYLSSDTSSIDLNKLFES